MNKYVKGIIVIATFIILIGGYYYYLSNFKTKPTEEAPAKVSEIQKLLLKNLDKDYPPTPKEVAKLYADITLAYYTEGCSDEEFAELAALMRELFDVELRDNTDNDVYLSNLRAEVNSLKAQGNTISSYSISSSTDVEFFTKDNHDCARLNIAFTIKNVSKNVAISKEVFILRKDINGHWKIFGWALAKDQDG
ncbi:MAG: hypothetical protein K5888_04075 [Lachnospiraceae bacterium]|nr:hypothetical protein [Lachnospiraceae bacterium]